MDLIPHLDPNADDDSPHQGTVYPPPPRPPKPAEPVPEGAVYALLTRREADRIAEVIRREISALEKQGGVVVTRVDLLRGDTFGGEHDLLGVTLRLEVP